MGTLLDETLWHSLIPNTFVFDLEYVGPTSKLDTCYIWEIGIVHWASGETLSVTIYPDIRPLPPAFSQEFVTLTHAFLTKRQACDFATGWKRVITWVDEHMDIHSSQNALFVAHNAFKADKPMLEIDTKRHGVTLPYTWFFLDSLIYCRKSMSKQSSYTLNDIYRVLMESDVPNAHYALSDAIALRDILVRINPYRLTGPIYPSHSTSLQAIKWLGPSSENILFHQNIRSVEQLVSLLLISYSAMCVNCVNGIQFATLADFITQYLSTNVGLKTGNAKSISNSIVEFWLP